MQSTLDIKHPSEVTVKTLQPVYGANQTFSGKAVVAIVRSKKHTTHVKYVLFSYDTRVAEIVSDPAAMSKVKLLPDAMYSMTTLKHVRDFLQQYASDWCAQVAHNKLSKSNLKRYVRV